MRLIKSTNNTPKKSKNRKILTKKLNYSYVYKQYIRIVKK